MSDIFNLEELLEEFSKYDSSDLNKKDIFNLAGL